MSYETTLNETAQSPQNIPTPLEQSDPELAEQLRKIAHGEHAQIRTLVVSTHGNAAVHRNGAIKRFGVPTPNEPCKCGSGRKYKKCCGGA